MVESSDSLIPPRPKPTHWRTALIWGGSILLLVALGFGGWQFYLRRAPDRLVGQARAESNAGKGRNAFLLLQRALQIDPESVAATMAMADMYEQAGTMDAISWRSRLMTLEPDVPQHVLDVAATCVRFRQVDLAKAALAKVPGALRGGTDFLALTGATALLERRWEDAAAAFAEARKLQPTNPEHAFNEANALINSPTEAVRKAAIIELEAAARGSEARLQQPARQTLRDFAATAGRTAEAVEWGRLAASAPEATWEDSLRLLTLMEAGGASDAASYLETLKTAAARDPANAAPLLQWMRKHRRIAESTAWAAQLPIADATRPEIALEVAAAYQDQSNWEAMERTLTGDGKDWGLREVLRLGLLSRAEQLLGKSAQSKATWGLAISAAARRPSALLDLAALASSWNRPADATDALWRIVALDPPETERALIALFSEYDKAQDTRGLLRVFTSMIERKLGGEVAQNNFIFMALLLEERTDQARALARRRAESQPADATVVCARAFAEFKAGAFKEAVARMKRLPEAQLTEPARAGYYGVMLAAAGEIADAQRYLRIAEPARMLPEERSLYGAARRKVGLP